MFTLQRQGPPQRPDYFPWCCAKEHGQTKDTVTTNKEDDKVNADHHVGKDGPSIGHDAIIHHGVPVLSSEDLQSGKKR